MTKFSILYVLLFLGFIPSLSSQICLDFENDTAQTIFVTDPIGQLLFSQDGVDILAFNYDSNFVPGCNTINISAPESIIWNYFSTNNCMTFCETAALVDLSNLPYTNKKITYRTFGNYYNDDSFENSANSVLCRINDLNLDPWFGGSPSNLTSDFNIVLDSLSVQDLLVEITGPIESILLGGFEAGFDDLCISEDLSTSISTPISEIDNQNQYLKVYPTLADNEISILKADILSFYKIYDMNGQLVYTGNETKVDVSNFGPGLYIVKYNERSSKFIKK